MSQSKNLNYITITTPTVGKSGSTMPLNTQLTKSEIPQSCKPIQFALIPYIHILLCPRYKRSECRLRLSMCYTIGIHIKFDNIHSNRQRPDVAQCTAQKQSSIPSRIVHSNLMALFTRPLTTQTEGIRWPKQCGIDVGERDAPKASRVYIINL